MNIRLRSLAAALSIASRTTLFLYISVKVYTHSTPEDVVDFFQLLFLQSVLITFLSASGYFRALGHGSSKAEDFNISIHAIFSLVGAFVIPAVLALTLTHVENQAVYTMLGFGAGMASISGSITGLTLRDRGPLQAFAPSTISGLVCILVAVLEPRPDANRCLEIIVIYQTLTALSLMVLNFNVVSRALSGGIKLIFNGVVRHLRANFLMGAVNTYGVLLLYFFREQWAENNDASLVSAAFLIIRVSDIGLQLFMTVYAGNRTLDRLPKMISLKSVMGVILVFITLALLVLTLHSNMDISVESLIWYLLVTQLLIDIIRFPLSSIFLYQVTVRRVSNYVLYAVIPVSIVFLCSILLNLSGVTFGVYLFMMGTSVLGALIFAIQNRRSIFDRS